jgi:predicted GNAT family acetyltransferase
MPWNFTGDVEVYADRVHRVLSKDPVENTLPLTVLESVRAGRRWSDDEMLFGWYHRDGQVCGAACMTPPFELLVASVDEDAIAELVTALKSRHVAVPGVNGKVSAVQCFIQAWTAATALRAETSMRMRLYVLGTLRPPEVAGHARPARERDIALVVRWMAQFSAELGTPAVDGEAAARPAIGEGRLWLWHDEAERVVSMAGRSPTVAGVARVAPVYTPPRFRRHGYGAAVTAACTADALRPRAERTGAADHVVLFTDLANPTSNSIYQKIGYRPVSDRWVVRFKS